MQGSWVRFLVQPYIFILETTKHFVLQWNFFFDQFENKHVHNRIIPFTVEHFWFFLPKSTTNWEWVDSCPVPGVGEWCIRGWSPTVWRPVDESLRQAGGAVCGPETSGQEVGRTDAVLHYQCSRWAPTDQHLEESGLAGQWKNRVKVTTCTAEFRDDLLSLNFIGRSKYFVSVQESGSWAIKLGKLD